MSNQDMQKLTQFFNEFLYFSDDDKDLITRSFNFSCLHGSSLVRSSGESWIDHPLRVATILAQLQLDAQTICTALLHGLFPQEHDEHLFSQVTEEFGATIATLSEGAARISGIKLQNKSQNQAEAIRKMFFALVDDLRIILVRLADRLDKMRNIKSYPPEQQKIMAQETLEIWAPLAHRLGIASIKVELEDLGLKFSNREVYDQIKSLVSAKKGERAQFLRLAEQTLSQAAQEAHITIDVKSRAKHFWSIYQKMKKRNKGVDELFDLLALRVLCPSVNDCYTVLGIVHSIWKPLDGRFKDYIASPKANGYQSLHTTVLCEYDIALEIQIRTYDMHTIAESGVASHWLYKQGASANQKNVEYASVVNRLKEVYKDGFEENYYLDHIKKELLGDSIYVFTPKGDIIELVQGATAIDFAYAIHTSIGEKIVGAKANGVIIPLSQSLQTTQVIDIITHPQAHPTINQYHSVKTAKARQKIRAWLKENDPSAIFEKTQHIEEKIESQGKKGHHKGLLQKDPISEDKNDSAVLKIRVGDTTNFMIKFAACCAPKPPHKITGYVSRGRGIIIHRVECTNLVKIADISNRLIPVEWETPKEPSLKKSKK